MKKGKMHIVNSFSHGATSKQGMNMHQKDNKGKGKSNKPITSELYLKSKKPHFKGNDQFYKKYRHKKAYCFKYKKWLEKKKKGTFLALACFESYTINVSSDT